MAKEFTLNNFHPQAFLLFADATRQVVLKKSSMKSRPNEPGIHKVVGNYRPHSVMSKVYNGNTPTGEKKNLIKANFFNLETYKISALIPELRFYKTDGKKFIPFYFPISAISDEAASASGNSRTKGSGITSFSVKYEGTDPYTAPRFLTADLNLYVDNIANLFDNVEGYAPLADLFTISIAKSALKQEINGATVTSGDLIRPIEVAATLGYVIPDYKSDIFTPDEIKEIKSSNISLRMNVVTHNIEVGQDGTANISVSYTARIDNTARDRIFSSVDNPVDVLKRADIRQLFLPEEKDISSTDKSRTQKGPATTRKSQIDKAIELRKILETLERDNRIYSIETTEESLRTYTQIGVPPAQKTNRTPAAEPQEVNANKAPKTPEPKISTKKAKSVDQIIEDLDLSKRRVYYVTFGDLLEAFFVKTLGGLLAAGNLLDMSGRIDPDIAEKDDESIKAIAKILNRSTSDMIYLAELAKKTPKEKEKIKEVILSATKKLSSFRILLADIEYKYFTEFEEEDAVRRVNLADVPIALETYQEFMFDKVVNSYRNTYTIPQFLNDCVNSLLPRVFGENWSNSGIAAKVISAPPKFTSTTHTAPQLKKSLQRELILNPEDVPAAQKTFRPASIEDEADYFVIYQSLDRELAADRAGDRREDSRDGIYHFLLGKNRGLIKSISFSRFDVPYAQEQLMTNQVGLYDELKMPYQASVTMVGNNLFIPGSQIYINPSNIGLGSPTDTNSPAFKIGLGGYYTVLGVSTTFTGDSLETSLECSFGSRAKNDTSLTPSGDVKQRLLGQIKSSGPSGDSEPQEIPELNTNLVEVSQDHYYAELKGLKDETTGQPILDDKMSKQISNDYILRREMSTVTIPGVARKEFNRTTGAVRYSLDRGETIEIDDSRPTTQSVSVVRTRRRSQNG
jgi:hypothetical protein|tara:strand:+ start:1796 stop:4528 length:2733 start_codon:yes stop_codon:yes gene_type:complete